MANPFASQQELALDVYKESIEANTVVGSGDTARAAEAMASRLRAAGLAASDVRVLVSAPGKGNLVARLCGTGKRPKRWDNGPLRVRHPAVRGPSVGASRLQRL